MPSKHVKHILATLEPSKHLPQMNPLFEMIAFCYQENVDKHSTLTGANCGGRDGVSSRKSIPLDWISVFLISPRSVARKPRLLDAERTSWGFT